jgi:integrase
MSVRKRRWITSTGEAREAWLVDYNVDGKRCFETFEKKKDADARHAQLKVDVKAGKLVAAAKKSTVASAAAAWIESAASDGLTRSTIDQYKQHVDQHILPFLGQLKLSEVSVPVVSEFKEVLRKNKRSPAMVRKVMVSLGTLLAHAQEKGLAGHNAVRDLRRNRKKKDAQAEKRKKTKLKVGVDIPLPSEIKDILANAKGRWRPLLVSAAFTGLRASELRGLRWMDVDLKTREIHVRQRADRYNKIDVPKSEAGQRTVPIGEHVAGVLLGWQVKSGGRGHGLVFPNGRGNIENHGNIINRGLIPAQLAAGITTQGKAKYTGMHALRHFYASWLINREADGGLGLPPKIVQTRMGHANLAITMDRYGHLFPSGDDGKAQTAAEGWLLG